MYCATIQFECYRDALIQEVDLAIGKYLDALRYNGQILGREFPTRMEQGVFVTRVVTPLPESLHANNASEPVKRALQGLHDAGILTPQVKNLGIDLHSDHADPCTNPDWQVLYTSFLSTCSPLRCGEHFAPIPLHKLPVLETGDYQPILRWQQAWSAADELQMNGELSTIERQAVKEISNHDSQLSVMGQTLAKAIEERSGIPTYYYLYRVGGSDKESEQNRPCPSCGGDWRLEQSVADILAFKCDACRLVSNLSWDFQ
ncbi:Zn-ribbon-containing protein [Paraferrimonas sedimenticola]|uniref:Zn-ribbon-containing protein n=1 Tax=Paraferrimonas sedimenticola TaxID=375674 RepID=A0AA37RW07_9GAMM|nr:Zn-ribbon-containing protein [Paraferrimonas sedimenticola]GLP96033.1 Zn-ribbon-containing protein [Paraferrimonas sedimenticola]